MKIYLINNVYKLLYNAGTSQIIIQIGVKIGRVHLSALHMYLYQIKVSNKVKNGQVCFSAAWCSSPAVIENFFTAS
jgi:hypothetical protein